MKKLHKIIAASLLASATTAGSGVVLAESPLTANVGVTSNYIWRGVTQADDLSAVSGGIDYAHASGAYVGLWTSNLNGGQYEQDIYAGYKMKAGPVGLDFGYIKYMYPVDAAVEADFDEVYVNASFNMFSAGLALTTDKEAGGDVADVYTSVGASFEVKKDLNLGITFGSYDFEDTAATDYSHYQLSLSKGDFTFAYDDNDLTGNTGDPRLSVTWSHSIDL